MERAVRQDMYEPTLKEVKKMVGTVNRVAIWREIEAELETPVSAYLKVARPPYSFLLESVEGEERIARYSFIGTEPYGVIKTGPGQKDGAVDPLGLIEKALEPLILGEVSEGERFNGGAVGYLSYETSKYFEKLPSPKRDPLNLPESVFMLVSTFLAFDHVRRKIRVVSHVNLDGDVRQGYTDAVGRIDQLIDRLNAPIPTRANKPVYENLSKETKSNMTKASYDRKIEKIINYIHAGDCIQVVFSQRFSRSTSAEPLEIYRALRGINPSPYMFFLNMDDFQMVGASPEMLVRCVGGHLEYHPIAGTRPRGTTPEEDAGLEEEMCNSEKEIAEHVMLVDLGRNDVGRVSKKGTVDVAQFMDVERYSHVMHLVSHITGELKDDLTSYDALRSCFPAGTLSGAPKIRAMEIIAELEPVKRGPYAGAVGYIDLKGNMDTAIALRTMIVKDEVAYVQAGGGIVADSMADEEYMETVHKSSALFRAIDEAESVVSEPSEGEDLDPKG